MRVAFCGGGTGGHVYPALTVAAALRRLAGGALELLYIGVRGKADGQLVAREGIPFREVTAGPLRTRSPLGTLGGGLKMFAGTAEAFYLLARFRPDVVFATGGYGSVGVGFAARLARRPLLLFEPGPEAGLAVRLLSRIADRVAVTIPPALENMPRSKTVLAGYPVREAFFAARRDEARCRLGLDSRLPTLLVSGASSGALTLNDAAVALAPSFLRRGQLLHLCGRNDEARLAAIRDAMDEPARQRYHLHAYLHDAEMADALAAADLAVMRSGASTLGELPAARLPAVLVPGEYEGWDQSPNARYLEQSGAAVLLPQSRLAELPATIDSLLADEERCLLMKQALASLARPDAADQLARMIIELAPAKAAAA